MLHYYHIKERDKWGDDMCVIIYDQNKRQRHALSQIIEQLYRESDSRKKIYCFDDSDKVMEHARNETVETAFISMNDRLGKGFFLARNLNRFNSRINLIVMADELLYANELKQMHISGYIIGDRTRQKVIDELDNLRY